MEGLYENKEDVNFDFQNAKEFHKLMRIYKIRNKDLDKEKADAIPKR